MNHSEMQHDHTAMMHHASDLAQTHSDTHIMQSISNFWSWSNSVETVLILLVIAFFILNKDAWQKHKILLGLTALVFFVSMHPLVDSIARHSVWLHCLQSSLIHHLLPLALLLTQANKIMPSQMQANLKTTVLVILSLFTFNMMSLMWILPSLHMQLMENGVLYSAMKWGMAITGILLCKTMLSFNQYQRIAGLNYGQFTSLMLLPQALIGVALMILPPLYLMPEAMMQHLVHTVALAQYMPNLSEQFDQFLGGLFFVLASLMFILIDLKRRQHAFSMMIAMPISKEHI